MTYTTALTFYRSYGIFGIARLACDWGFTRLCFPTARLIRRPIYVRGRRWMNLGSGLTTGPGLRLDAFPELGQSVPILVIGSQVQINDYVHIASIRSIFIGNRVLIASKVFITDHQHGTYRGPGPHADPSVPPADRSLSCTSVRIEDDVWIGESVSILPGVTIGRGSVVGCMATVTRDVPPYTIVAGSPARVIKRFNFTTSMWEPT